MRNQMFTCSGWLLGILFVVSVPTFAQNEYEKGLPFVTDYTPKIYNGSSTNWSAIQGNDGIVYFGQSNSGSNLLQYDGVKWEKISSRRSSIISRCQGKDKNGVIYYGGSGEFGYLDKDSIGKTQEHSLVQYLPKDKRNFGDVWSINFADKDIFFQSRERLFRLTKTSSGKDEDWTVKTWEPSTHFMYSFYVGDVFYVHEQGVGLLKMVNDSLMLIAGSEFLGSDRMQVFLNFDKDSAQKNSANQKEYLLGTFRNGLYIFDGKNFRPFKTDADSIAKQYMLYRGVRSNGNYILSFLGYGLVVISPQGKIMQIINKNTGLVSDVIYAIYPDNKGDLWLAQDNGISKVSVNSPFTVFNAQSGIVAAPLSLARIPDGSLYVGTNNGLLKFNPATSKFDINNQVPRNQVFNVVTDGNTLLVPCDGLFMIKNEKTMLVQPSVNNNLKGTTILISKKHPELMYVGTSFGVVLFIRDPSKITGWQFLGNIPDFKGEVFSLAETGEGSVWGATVNGTPFRFTLAFDLQGKPDISKTKVESFGEEQGLKVTLGFVFELAHKVYFTSDSATYTFNEKQHAFEKATFNNFSNFVGFEDSTGRIWMTVGNAENYKLIIATPQPGGSYQLDSTSLLPVIDQLGLNSTVYPDKDGIVWFTNPDRLIRYDDKIKSKVDLPYKVLISDITAGNQKLNPYGTPQKNSYEIKSDDNSLSFQYAAPFFEQEDKTQYQTWLEGFEKTWSAFGKNTYKEYTNLSAGKYTFHVRAKNLYHTISEEAAYSFTILPPWYNTWWAYCLYLILFGLLAFGFIRRQRYRVIAKERQRSEMREANLKAEAENERRKNIELISEMGRDITASLSIEHIIDTVYAHVNKLMDASVFGIGIHNKEKHELEFPATKEKGQTLATYSYELGDTTRPASWCFNNKKEIFINDLEKEHQAYISDIPDATEGENSESIIYLPLIYKDKSIGVITAQSFSKNAYNDYHLNILRSLATYTAVALDNADAYRNLKATQTQLVQSEKMASLGELTAGIAHEIQNPLNFVNNFSEVNEELLTEMKDELVKGKIDDAVALANDAIENQKKIIHHGKRADAIVKSMLQHSRASSGKQEPTDINALCDEYIRLSYHGLRAKDKSFNAKFETDLDSTIEKINIVPQEMGRVVLNLINNAFYAVDEKKKQHHGHFEPTVLLSTKRVGDKVLIAIKDNGNGIPQKVSDKIFQPFFTTKPTGEGTGLGLSLSYDIVKAHGGEIKMKTREGEGTEFVIQLPLVH